MPETDSRAPGRVLSWLLKEWASRLGLALQSMTGVTASIETGGPEPSPASASEPPPAGFLWWQQPFQPIPEAIIWVGAAEPAWTAIGGLILSAAGVDDATPDDLRGTYLEVIRQGLSGVAQALSGLVHADVLCSGGEECPQAPDGGVFPVRISQEGQPPIELSLVISSGLTRQTGSPGPASALGEAPSPDAAPAEEPDTNRTIDLLYDVELPVSVSFGRAHLPLREILKLTSGSIVELNRTITEPVEVIVNNCVIARGEVVVVDGNYGVRIRKIVSRRERLRTLY